MAEVEINPVQKPQFVASVASTNPIEITTVAPHGLVTGAGVTRADVCHVAGNVCANQTALNVTVISPTVFSFNGIDGSDPGCGVYTSGGVYTPNRETVHENYGGGSNGIVGPGPWVYNGLLHTLVSDGGDSIAGVAGLHIMRRNGDGTWVKLDNLSPNVPSGLGGNTRATRGVFRRGTNIWMMRPVATTAAPPPPPPTPAPPSSSTSTSAPQIFDLATGLWGAVLSSGALPRYENFATGTPPNGAFQKIRALTEMVVRSNGEVVFMHPGFREQGADSRWYSRVYYEVRSTGGTWGGPVAVFGVPGELVNYSSREMCIDASDRTHFFGLRTKSPQTWGVNASEGEIVYRNLDSGGTLSSQVVLTDEVVNSNGTSPIGPAFIYTKAGGGEEIVVPFVRGVPSGGFGVTDSLRVLRATAGASPSWSIETIASASPSLPATGSLPGGNRNEIHAIASFAYDANTDTLHCFWQTVASQVTGDNPSEIHHSQNSGGGWSAPDVFKTGNGLTSNWANPSSVPITDPEQPVWYGFPVPTVVGANVEVIFGRFAQWQVEDCAQQMSFASPSRTHEFPHIDQFSLCPPAGGRKRYAYFFQTR